MTTQGSLNVNTNNINNKRLSRLQGVILKILARIHPNGYRKRDLCHIAAAVYGNKRVIERPLEALEIFIGMKNDPEIREIGKAFSLNQPQVLAPEFSVSFSRSIKSLSHQGLITRWGDVFITDKGLARIQDRKVKVHAKNWDAFLAYLSRGK